MNDCVERFLFGVRAILAISIVLLGVPLKGLGQVEAPYNNHRINEQGVLVDRFMGLIALQAIGLVALVFGWHLVPFQVVVLTVFLFVASLTAAWVVSYHPRLSLFFLNGHGLSDLFPGHGGGGPHTPGRYPVGPHS